MSTPGWKRVFSSPQQHVAALVHSILQQHQVQAVLLNKRDTSYPFGFYEVHVPPHLEPVALSIIENEIQL